MMRLSSTIREMAEVDDGPEFVTDEPLQCTSCSAQCLPLVCGRCRCAVYCSEACQRRDWGEGHCYYCAEPPVEPAVQQTAVEFRSADLLQGGRPKYVPLPSNVLTGRYAVVRELLGAYGVADLYYVDYDKLSPESRIKAIRQPAGATILGVILVRFPGKPNDGFLPAMNYLFGNNQRAAHALALDFRRRIMARYRSDAPLPAFPEVPTTIPKRPVAPVPVERQQPRRAAPSPVYVAGYVPPMDDRIDVETSLGKLTAPSMPFEFTRVWDTLSGAVYKLTGKPITATPNPQMHLTSEQISKVRKHVVYARSSLTYDDMRTAVDNMLRVLNILSGGQVALP